MMIRQALAAPSDGQCIPWQHSRDKDGYGRVIAGDRTVAVHRLACEAKHGPAPDGLPHALHSCGNGNIGCFNPHHLKWGTHAQNMRDMVASGKSKPGELNPNARITEQQVREIRANAGIVHKRDLALKFGIAPRTVAKIQAREMWAHI